MTDDLGATIDEHPRPSCPAITRSGARCAGTMLAGDEHDGRCFAHSPALAAARDAGRVQGGRHRATAHRAYVGLPDPIAEVLDGLVATFDQTRAGTIDPTRARAVASVGRSSPRGTSLSSRTASTRSNGTSPP